MDFSLLPPSPDPHMLTPLTPCTGTDSSIPYHQSIPLQYTGIFILKQSTYY